MGKEKLKKAGKYLSIVIAGYILSFYILIDTNFPAIDHNMEIAFKSSFTIGTERMTNHRGVTVYYRRVSIFNYFYLPIDKLHHAMFPDSYKVINETMFNVKS